MKLILLISVVVICKLVSCQVFDRCWDGRSRMERDGEVSGNFTESLCDLESQKYLCESRIQLSNGILEIERKCKQAVACRNNEANNDNDCYSEQSVNNDNRVCHFCCDFDLCNDFDQILPQTGGEEGGDGGVDPEEEEEIVGEFDFGVFEEPDGLVPIVIP